MPLPASRTISPTSPGLQRGRAAGSSGRLGAPASSAPLRLAARSRATRSGQAATSNQQTDRPTVFLALHDTIQRFDLPVDLFSDLLSAFRQDVTTTRYATWAEVLDYCRRSANPVGRLVLRVFGYRRDDLDAASDALCTALQLTNFWQDLRVDWSRGRLYVPEDVWRRHGADPSALSNRQLTGPWRSTLGDVVPRTRQLFERGRPVCDGVSGRLRYELRATWLGGTRVLERLERSGFDVSVRKADARSRRRVSDSVAHGGVESRDARMRTAIANSR